MAKVRWPTSKEASTDCMQTETPTSGITMLLWMRANRGGASDLPGTASGRCVGHVGEIDQPVVHVVRGHLLAVAAHAEG